MIEREQALQAVITCLKEAVVQTGGDPAAVEEQTVIIGPGAPIDSIGVVSLIVDIEQRLEMDFQVSVTLASDKAMSQKNSPFRTAGVLADHVLATEKEGQAA